MKFGRDRNAPIVDEYTSKFEDDCAEIESLSENITQRTKHKKSIEWGEMGFEVPEYIMNDDDKSEFDFDEVNGEKYEYDKFNQMGPSAPRAHLTSKKGASNFNIWPAPMVSGFDRMKDDLANQDQHSYDSLDAIKKADKKRAKDFDAKLKKIQKMKGDLKK